MSEGSRDREEGTLQCLVSVCINVAPFTEGEETERGPDFQCGLGLGGHAELRVPILYMLKFNYIRDFSSALKCRHVEVRGEVWSMARDLKFVDI